MTELASMMEARVRQMEDDTEENRHTSPSLSGDFFPGTESVIIAFEDSTPCELEARLAMTCWTPGGHFAVGGKVTSLTFSQSHTTDVCRTPSSIFDTASSPV